MHSQVGVRESLSHVLCSVVTTSLSESARSKWTGGHRVGSACALVVLTGTAMLLGGCASAPRAASPTNDRASEARLRAVDIVSGRPAQLPLPSARAVSDFRFVFAVGLDNSGLVVASPPAGSLAALSAAKGWRDVDSATTGPVPQLQGKLVTFGLGVLTLVPALDRLLPTGDRFDGRLAWVAVSSISGVTFNCPPIGFGTRPPILPRGAERDPGYEVVAVDAATGLHVVAYESRTSVCMEPFRGPTVDAEEQLVSVPWLEGPGVDGYPLAIYTMPACGTLSVHGATGSDFGRHQTFEIAVEVPYDRAGCGASRSASIADELPIGITVTHAPTGPLHEPAELVGPLPVRDVPPSDEAMLPRTHGYRD